MIMKFQDCGNHYLFEHWVNVGSRHGMFISEIKCKRKKCCYNAKRYQNFISVHLFDKD